MNGTGQELRDWLYIEDAIQILVAAGKYTTDRLSIMNGGTGIGTSVNDVVNLLCQAWEISPEIAFSGQKRHGDPLTLVANIEKLNRLGFKPTYSLDRGIEKYINWFKHRERI